MRAARIAAVQLRCAAAPAHFFPVHGVVVRPDDHFVLKVDDKEVRKPGRQATRANGRRASLTAALSPVHQVRSGKLSSSEEFTPPLEPPKMIDDPEDAKPTSWVDEEMVSPTCWWTHRTPVSSARRLFLSSLCSLGALDSCVLWAAFCSPGVSSSSVSSAQPFFVACLFTRWMIRKTSSPTTGTRASQSSFRYARSIVSPSLPFQR